MYGKNRKLLKTAGRKRFSMRMTNPFKRKDIRPISSLKKRKFAYSWFEHKTR